MHEILIDTCILVDYFRYDKTATKKHPERKLNSASARAFIIDAAKHYQLTISVITLKELLQYPNISPKEEKRIVDNMLKVCNVLPVNLEVAKTAGLLCRNAAEYKGKHIEDCYIAATAIVFNAPLYTRNPKDFNCVTHPNLIIEVPY